MSGCDWECNLCGKKFKRQRSVDQHKTATKGRCRIDVKAWNQSLLQFHDDKANLCVGARRRSKGIVQDVLSDILCNRGNKRRYETEAKLEGSYKTGLKIGKPDEFDFSLGLRLPRSHHVTGSEAVGFQYTEDDMDVYGSAVRRQLYDREIENTEDQTLPPVGYKVVRVRKGRRNPFNEAIVNGVLVPFEVLLKFHDFVTSAVDSLGTCGTTVGKYARGPAISLNITDERIRHKISVDLTPVVYFGIAEPILTDHGWPRTTTLDWLSQDKIQSVQDTEIYLVPKGDKFWKVSFARCEDEILRDVDGPGVDGTRKTCLRICKMKLKQWKSKSESGMKAISSYMLKTLMLWLCESLPDGDDWCESQLSSRYLNFLEDLQNCLKKCYLGEYFIPAINLLEDKDQDDIEEMLDFVESEINSMVGNTDCAKWLTLFDSRES